MNNKLTYVFILISAMIFLAGTIDLNTLFNYENQDIPAYIIKDNTPIENQLTDPEATLGRVLFYDKSLSVDNTIACASCHLQEFAFGDTAVVSKGVNGVTGRHSMRLINARFSFEKHAFWNERATTFEDQATQPIQDHIEMGFSGENGDPSMDDLILKMESKDYYKLLFGYAYGDEDITENKIQKSLAQFIRSIQSYDSKYDIGRAESNGDFEDFPNFSDEENLGKNLFNVHPPLGGAGCARCHAGPEFSIVRDSKNNGVIGVAGSPSDIDLLNSKPPSLRDLVNPQGKMNGPFMHDGSLSTLLDVINHYNDIEIDPENNNLDFRLNGEIHKLNLEDNEKSALVAFLKTLTGNEVYTSEKWSNPFDEQGNLTIIPHISSTTNNPSTIKLNIFPIPAYDYLNVEFIKGEYQILIYDISGLLLISTVSTDSLSVDIRSLTTGIYIVSIIDMNTNKLYSKKVLKI